MSQYHCTIRDNDDYRSVYPRRPASGMLQRRPRTLVNVIIMLHRNVPTYILQFSVFGLRTVLIKQSAIHMHLMLMFQIK